MNDPHVEALYYNLKPAEYTRYDNPPPITISTQTFDGILDSGIFIARMTQHFASEAEARPIVDSFLRAWEVSASLQMGREEFKFEFDHSDIVDRAPQPSCAVNIHVASVGGRITLFGNATVVLIRNEYTGPLQNFNVTMMVEMLWNRYKHYLQGKEPLFSMSYFCLTALEKHAGNRKKVAAKYDIEQKVLNTIGNISTNRGGAIDARKMPKNGFVPPSQKELEWLAAAIRQLILQVGIIESGSKPQRLTMGKLPKL
jgi:hypothetical protein